MRKKLKAYIRWFIPIILFTNITALPHVVSTEHQVQLTVEEFYGFHFSHDMDFTIDSLKQKKMWLEPKLYDLSLYAIARRDKFEKECPRMKSYFEGDLFTNTGVYPQRFEVGEATVLANSAKVEVKFYWAYKGREIGPTRVYVELNKTRKKWLIANISYGDDEDLITMLSRAKQDIKCIHSRIDET